MIGESGYRPKSPEEIRQQLENAQNALGIEVEHMFTPPSVDRDAILQMPLEEIKIKYARRYEMYLQILRDQKYYEKKDPDELHFFDDDLKFLKKWICALNSLDIYIQEHHEGTEVTLREKQITIFEDLRNFIEAGGEAGYVKLPTGVGKTVLFVELIEALNLKTLIVVPTKILVGQTADKIEQFAEELDVGKISSMAKQFGRQVTIITYASFVRQIEAGTLNPDDYDCLVLDEVHESLSGKRKETVQKFDKALKLGFTATPKYSDKKHVKEILPTEIHTMSIKEAVEGNLLCSFSSVLARTTVDLSKVSIDNKGEFSESELEQAVNIKGRNQAAVEMYKKAFAGEHAVVYCVGVKHAEAVAKEFIENGVPATAISGKSKNQEEILEKFKSGEIKVLCNADILIAGFDEPQASVCLNLRPTLSKVVAEQRGGRVLRLNKEDPTKYATIVDFIDGDIPEERFPVLFAHIAGRAQIMNPTIQDERDGGGGGGIKGPNRFADIQIEGLQVSTDTEEIMKVVNEHPKEDTEKVKKLSFEDLKKEVRGLKITSGRQYRQVQKEKTTWPSAPYEHYNNWVSWSDFLGKEEFLPFSILQEQVQKAGIKNKGEYSLMYSDHPGWPSSPAYTYGAEFPGWPTFLGKEVKKFLSFIELKRDITVAGVTSQLQYRKEWKNHKGWPSTPEETYKKEWTSWQEFLGKEPPKKFLSFDIFYQEVLLAEIKTSSEYKKVYKNHDGWPAEPWIVYKESWPEEGWRKFLGKEIVQKLTYGLLKEEVRKLGIDSVTKYRQAHLKNSTWPSDPVNFYRNEWISWSDFFGI